MWKNNHEAAIEYQNTNNNEALFYLYQNNEAITNKIGSNYISVFEKDYILTWARKSIIIAADKYQPNKGKFSSLYWSVLNNNMIDLQRKSKSRYAKRIRTWTEFERQRKKYRNLFDHEIIKRECNLLQNDDYNKLSERQKDYLSLMLHISVIDEIAIQAMGISRSSFYYMKKGLKKVLRAYIKAYQEQVLLLSAIEGGPIEAVLLREVLSSNNRARGMSVESPQLIAGRDNDEAEAWLQARTEVFNPFADKENLKNLSK